MKNKIDQNTLKKPELNDYNLTEEKVSIYKEQLKVFEEEQKKINEYNRELRRDQEKADSNAWGWALIGFVIGGFITAMLSQNNDGFGIFIGIIAGFGLPVLFYRMYKGNCNAYMRSEKKLDKFGIVDKDLESNYINYKKALWTYELEMNRRTRQFWIELGGFEFEEEIANLLNSLGAKAKLTPKQLSKADLQGGITNFSDIFKAVEEANERIPIFPEFKYRPNDAVDFILWCYINYERNLNGLPEVKYSDIYKFYDEKKQEYIDMYGDPYGIFTNDPTLDNRDTVEKFITVPIEFREGDE